MVVNVTLSSAILRVLMPSIYAIMKREKERNKSADYFRSHQIQRKAKTNKNKQQLGKVLEN